MTSLSEGASLRITADFAPDETALVGAGIGFAQAGLLPIVEIPYAKYLDCGADQFHEVCARSLARAVRRGWVRQMKGRRVQSVCSITAKHTRVSRQSRSVDPSLI